MDLTEIAIRFVRLYGPLALFCFTFLESSMLFPFLPSEVVVPAAAALLITDLPSFLVFVLAASAGGTLGAFVLFYVFRSTRLGESDWLRVRIHVSDAQIERGQDWFRRWGGTSVLWGRFLPVLRSVISIPAGLAQMHPLRFGVFTAVGTAGFYAATGAVIYYGRHQSFVAAAITVITDRPVLAAGALFALLAGGWLVGRWVRRWSRWE